MIEPDTSPGHTLNCGTKYCDSISSMCSWWSSLGHRHYDKVECKRTFDSDLLVEKYAMCLIALSRHQQRNNTPKQTTNLSSRHRFYTQLRSQRRRTLTFHMNSDSTAGRQHGVVTSLSALRTGTNRTYSGQWLLHGICIRRRLQREKKRLPRTYALERQASQQKRQSMTGVEKRA